jgi:hypothetical protein
MFNLLDKGEACRFFGGSKPLNPAPSTAASGRGGFPAPLRSVPALRAGCAKSAKLSFGGWLRGGCHEQTPRSQHRRRVEGDRQQ